MARQRKGKSAPKHGKPAVQLKQHIQDLEIQKSAQKKPKKIPKTAKKLSGNTTFPKPKPKSKSSSTGDVGALARKIEDMERKFPGLQNMAEQRAKTKKFHTVARHIQLERIFATMMILRKEPLVLDVLRDRRQESASKTAARSSNASQTSSSIGSTGKRKAKGRQTFQGKGGGGPLQYAQKRDPPRLKALRLCDPTLNSNLALPWMQDTYVEAARVEGLRIEASSHTSNSTQRKQMRPLPTGHMDQSAMKRFDQEILALAAYVRLGDTETRLREHFVQEMRYLAQQLRPQNNHMRFGKATGSSEEEVTVQIFGSFATPQVCCFTSDVDLALHGVVPKPPLPKPKTPPKEPDPPSNKHLKLQRWRDVLATADEENMLTPDIIRMRSESMVSQHSNPAESLFVLDRVGNTTDAATTDPEPLPKPTEDATTEKKVSPVKVAAVEVSGLPELAALDANESVDSVEEPEDNEVGSATSSRDSADKLQRSQNPADDSAVSTESGSQASAPSYFEEDDDSSLGDHLGDEEDDLEVSFVANGGATRMSKGLRAEITSKLAKFSNIVRKSKLVSNVLCIRTARVPIVKMNTSLGFESDVAIGGHVGTDTSTYALSQVNRFASFAPVVLLLKILLQQQDLDVPFAGGLGSYKLYVLVAHHISQHLLAGGLDRPGEIFLSFLFRYGMAGDHTTRLSINTELRADEGSDYAGVADLSNVFHITTIVRLFRLLWGRLSHALHTKSSELLLPLILHVGELKKKRETLLSACMHRARQLGITNNRNTPGKRVKNSNSTSYVPDKKARASTGSREKDVPRDLSADELIKGYGL